MPTKANAPTPIPTSAPTDRLGDVVAAFVPVTVPGDVGTVAELVMLICPVLAIVELNVVDEGPKDVLVAGVCPVPLSVNVCVLTQAPQAVTAKFAMDKISPIGHREIRHDPTMVPIAACPELPQTHAVSLMAPQTERTPEETQFAM
jgi:hypothetical protein